MFDPVTDLLTLEEACQYLELPPFRIALAIAYNELRCGVIARNWRGNALPSRNDIPRGTNGHQWNSPGIEQIFDKDRKDRAWRIYLDGINVSYLIRTAWAGHFWYLDHGEAYRLFYEEFDGIDVKFLEPHDGAFHHRHQPDRFPEPEFTFFVDDDQPNRRVTTKDLLFVREDLNRLQREPEAKPLSDRAETTYLNIIGAMLALMLGKSPAGKPQSIFDNQAAIIDALLGHYEGKPGISKRTLEDKFAAAKRSLTAT